VNHAEQFKIIEDWLGRPMTDLERDIAKAMLDTTPTQFGGSYSPGFIARRLSMLEKAQRVA
jgi:hypothetical protein